MQTTYPDTLPVTAKKAPPVRHRVWIPVTVLLLVSAALATPLVLHENDWLPEQRANIGVMAEMFGVTGAAGVILVWWLCLSGVSWRLRAAVVLMLALAAGGFVYAQREPPKLKPIFTYYLVPTFSFKWEKTPDDFLDAYTGPNGDGAIDLTRKPSDFPWYRGQDGDGVAHGPELAADWSTTAPRIVYKRPCIRGYSGFAVSGNAAITLEQRKNKDTGEKKETVVCYDRQTGRQCWTYDRLGTWDDVMGDGPRATPAIDRGLVFAVGATGVLVCLDAAGKEKWSHNILEDSGSKNVQWGLSCSPLIVDDLVVVNPGVDPAKNAGRAVCAYHRETGSLVWAAGDHKAGYSSPRLATLGGMRQILIFDGARSADDGGGLRLDPADGKELWRYGWATIYDMNCIQPLVIGDDRVFISSEIANGCAMVRVRKEGNDWKVEEVWKHKKFASKFSNPVVVGVAIYGLSGGDLFSIGVDTGEIFWKERSHGRFGNGQLLAAGDKLIVQGDEGRIYLVAAETTAYKQLGQLQVFERGFGEGSPKTWNTPALAGDQLFLRDNDREMACVELPIAKP